MELLDLHPRNNGENSDKHLNNRPEDFRARHRCGERVNDGRSHWGMGDLQQRNFILRMLSLLRLFSMNNLKTDKKEAHAKRENGARQHRMRHGSSVCVRLSGTV